MYVLALFGSGCVTRWLFQTTIIPLVKIKHFQRMIGNKRLMFNLEVDFWSSRILNALIMIAQPLSIIINTIINSRMVLEIFHLCNIELKGINGEKSQCMLILNHTNSHTTKLTPPFVSLKKCLYSPNCLS